MEIVYESNNQTVAAGEVDYGECFYSGANLFMRIYDNNLNKDGYILAISMKTGEVFTIARKTSVIPVKVQAVVKDRICTGEKET